MQKSKQRLRENGKFVSRKTMLAKDPIVQQIVQEHSKDIFERTLQECAGRLQSAEKSIEDKKLVIAKLQDDMTYYSKQADISLQQSQTHQRLYEDYKLKTQRHNKYVFMFFFTAGLLAGILIEMLLKL